jgi:hypothetical protein
LSTPAITLIVVAASSSLFRASFSSVALPFSASFSLRAVLSSLMIVSSPFLDMNSSVYSARKLNFFLMLSRSVVAAWSAPGSGVGPDLKPALDLLDSSARASSAMRSCSSTALSLRDWALPVAFPAHLKFYYKSLIFGLASVLYTEGRQRRTIFPIPSRDCRWRSRESSLMRRGCHP